MTRHLLLAAIAGLAIFNSTGCCLWKHCFGSWAYYGCDDTYGYCDGCPPGPCGKHCGGCDSGHCGGGDCGNPWAGHSCHKCKFEHGACAAIKKHHHGGCGDNCCGGLGCCPPAGGYGNCGYGCQGCNDGCGCGDCGHGHHCGPLSWLKKCFHCCHDCQGCGEKYCCDWINYPPKPDPCDCCANYIGPCGCQPRYQMTPRVGSVPMSHGVTHAGGEHFEGEYVEE